MAESQNSVMADCSSHPPLSGKPASVVEGEAPHTGARKTEELGSPLITSTGKGRRQFPHSFKLLVTRIEGLSPFTFVRVLRFNFISARLKGHLKPFVE